jgi:hypothetical protein
VQIENAAPCRELVELLPNERVIGIVDKRQQWR